jgi:uncharacterized linocin/CFP29 family protein
MTTQSLQQRATTYFDNKMIDPLLIAASARVLYDKVTTLPANTFVYEYEKITDMGDALITYDIPDETASRDSIASSPESMRLAVISKRWEVPYSKWQAFKNLNIDLPTKTMESAIRVIGKKERNVLLQSWKPDGSNARINGLYAVAGNSYTSAADFATVGKAVEAIGGALDLMRADEITGVNFNLTLNSTQFTQLTTSTYTNGDLEWDRVMKLLNMDGGPGAPAGTIRWSPEITAGTGLISPVDPTGMYMELIIGQPTRNIIGFVSEIEEISPMIGTTYEILGPRVIFPNAICTLTTI